MGQTFIMGSTQPLVFSQGRTPRDFEISPFSYWLPIIGTKICYKFIDLQNVTVHRYYSSTIFKVFASSSTEFTIKRWKSELVQKDPDTIVCI